MEKISFIIPAYNSENYIIKCLKKIEEDILSSSAICEILVVENGSSDNTTSVIEKYIKKTKIDIKLFHSEKGVSNARNLGIKKATGEYIIFVDADDVWVPGSLELINNDINKYNSDLYAYSFVKGLLEESYNNCQKIIHNTNYSSSPEELKNTKNWMISNPTLTMQCWSKIYKKSILIKNKILFNRDLKYAEDSDFNIRVLNNVESIYISDKTIYKYVISPNSAMRKKNDERINEYIKSMTCSKNYIDNYTDFGKSFNKYVLIHLNIILVHDVFDINIKLSFFKKIKQMNQLKSNLIFKNSLDNVKLKEVMVKNLLPELFMKLHLNILAGLLCHIKSRINNK